MTNETKRKLVSFGNYLLEKYNVMVYSTDGKNIPIYRREVTHADIENWIDYDEIKESEKKINSYINN